jgi:hypothetical protein
MPIVLWGEQKNRPHPLQKGLSMALILIGGDLAHRQ